MDNNINVKGKNVKKVEEVSLKEIIISLKGLIKTLLKYKLWILLSGIIGAVLGWVIISNSEPQYQAKLTFLVEDSKSSNPLATYSGIASQFGIDLGGGSSSVFEGNNILDFMKSRLMIERTLLSNLEPQDTFSLADLYVRTEKLHRKWAKVNPEFSNIYFNSNQSRTEFSRVQDSLLNILHQDILKKHLSVTRTYKTSNFIFVKFKSNNEVFAKKFAEHLVDQATSFYIETKLKRARATVEKIQATADSIEAQLNKVSYSLANTQDLNLNAAKNKASISSEGLARDKLMLQTMYGEVIKNLELSKLNMLQETPVIQIIDSPILPLENVNMGRMMGGGLGGIVGAFLCVMIILSHLAYKKIMN